LVIFMITVAACEAGIAMALILMLAQRTGNLDSLVWQDLREEGQPAYVDQQVPEERAEDQVWPTLTPAGREPLPNVDEQTHRSRV
jgi:NADH-quinone oxidoreductase subunit K